MATKRLLVVMLTAAAWSVAAAVQAQPLGTFRWQLHPYCNVVTLAVTQNGGVYRLEGTDDQCGSGGVAGSVTGTAFPNPNGSIGFGLNIVGAPGGAPVHVDATVALPALSGSWRDSAGNVGAFTLTPGAGTGGAPRPVVGTIGASAINTAQVQLRVSGSCAAGSFMQSIGQNGTVGCAAAGGGGGITAVVAGAGLAGGGAAGAVTLSLRTAAGAFDFSNPNGLVAAGTFGSGAIGASGTGTRMLWHPRKAAFRAGFAGGSEWDDANVGDYSTAVGFSTVASGTRSLAAGRLTLASGPNSAAFGDVTSATGANSTALGDGSTAGGIASLAAGTLSNANGLQAVALGLRLNANGHGNVVLGSDATSATTGNFMYGDRSTTNHLTTAGSNEFLVRAAGGTIFYSNAAMSTGVLLSPGGGGWSNLSDVHMKTGFRDLDGEQVLRKLASMPVREWQYKTQDATIRHVGPTAQDFRAAFGLGESAVRIGTVDADGIALAAVKALEARTRTLPDDARALRDQLAALTRENADLRARLARVEAVLGQR